jgi:serine phosphatase RsbU (regulator of sigma subunit)/Tfp pilus assembly protein PilF
MNLRCAPYILVLLLSSLIARAQKIQSLDSLRNVVATTRNDSIRIRALLTLSIRYQGLNTDSAFAYGRKALKAAELANRPASVGDANNNLGDLYWYKGDYSLCSDHYIKALTIFEKLNDKPSIADSYRNLGWIYFSKDNYKQARDYYNRSLAINLAMHRKVELAQNYNDIGVVDIHSKEYAEALEFLEKSLKLQKEIGNKEGMATAYGNLAIVYDETNNIDKAVDCIEKATQLAEEMGGKQHLAAAYCNLGSFYAKAKKYDKAVEILHKGIGAASEVGFKSALIDIYKNLAAIYSKTNDFQKAYEYEDLITRLKDTIYNDNNSRQVNEMTAKYESEKKEIMISSLEKDQKLSNDKLEQGRIFKIGLGLFCLMIAGFAFMLYRGNVHKKKANVALSHAYKEIELKNKDITDSINYSKRIQEASLPPKELKHKLFPEAFVLFRPKDIVSGDFYWYTEKNGKRLIAACDCTGHGVPGALMSMIGNNLLNQIVIEKGVTTPSEILDRLHEEVRKSLKQNEQAETRDGMDISLISIEGEKIEFAGAQRPLWIINNGEVEEIKGNKFSIGGLQTEDHRNFSNHMFVAKPGDCLYLFTDGFVDQFGGDEGKKFMTRNFRKLLLSCQGRPMAMQEKLIESALLSWKGKCEQVDDILVIGLQI